MLLPGVTEAEVDRKLGPEFLRRGIDDGVVAVYYKVDGVVTVEDFERLDQVQVFFKDSKLIKWSPVYAQTSTGSPMRRTTPAPKSNQTQTTGGFVDFYVSDDPTIINGRVLPDGFFQSSKGHGGKPDFRLAKIDTFAETDIINGDRSAAVLYSVRLRLAKENVGPFEVFSVKNQGNRIVVLVGSRCVFAGVILSPISTGEFEMSGLTLDSLNAIKPILTEISSK